MKKIIVLLLICFCLLSFTGCVLFTVGLETQQEEKVTDEHIYHIGDTFECGNFEVTILSSGIADSEEYEPMKDGNIGYYIEVEAKNISDSDCYIFDDDFTLYADDYVCENAYNFVDPIQKELASGKKVRGRVVFDIPQEYKNIEIRFENSNNEVIIKP